jgi:hypothetical protein
METLAEHTLILYIRATGEDEKALIARAVADPKPLYYRDDFLDQQLVAYRQEKGIQYVAQIEPDDFVRWMFPRLFRERIPRYEAIAKKFGYTVTTEAVARVRTEADFLALVKSALG